MRTDTPVTVYRKDYQPYPYDIPEVSLGFDLVPESTEVRCVMQVRRKPGASADAALVLDGEELELVSVGVDGSPLPADRYHLAEHSLALYGLPETATVEIVSRCKPAANSTLMGLYVSGGNFFTQCEAEGFRRITWFADRPDVMSRYRVTLRATADYPVLLSNGNLLASRQLADGRNEVEWEDPSPSPATCSRWSRASSRTAKPCAPPAAATCCCRSTAIPARKTRPNGPWIRWARAALGRDPLRLELTWTASWSWPCTTSTWGRWRTRA